MTVRTAHRNRTIAAIHVLAKQLGMDDGQYRDCMFAVARARSCSDLDSTGLERFRQHLARLAGRCGKPPHASRFTPDPEWDWVNRAAADRRPMLWKIRALLKAAGIEPGKQKAYAEGIARQMFKIERLELCDAWNLHAIVTALVKESKRRATGVKS